MSPEERNLLTDLFNRTRNAAATPRDGDAEALIAAQLREQPAAPYYLAQAVIVQEKALAAASRQINALEERLAAMESGRQQPAPQGGFLNSLFGTSRAAEPPPAQGGPWGRAAPSQPQPSSFAPAPQAFGGPWGAQQQQAAPGGGFLHGALGTAAGVAGGMLLANSLSGLFGGHSGISGLGSPFGGAGLARPEIIEETVVNNNYGDTGRDAGDSPLLQASDDDDNDFANDGDSFV